MRTRIRPDATEAPRSTAGPGPTLVLPLAAVVIALIAVALVGQALLDRPVLGPAGLLVAIVPAVALVEAIGSGRRPPWPDRLLAWIAAWLAVSVVSGIVAGLSPRGLDAASVAIAELIVLALAVAAWLWRRGVERRTVDAALTRPRRSPARSGGPVAVALALAGLLLGATGVAIATRAAETQDYGAFVQFWALPARTGQPTEVGVRNDASTTLRCSVNITRPNRPTLGFQVDPLAPGQQWTGELAPAGAGETTRWQLALSCSGGPQPLHRLLLIDPPGSPTTAGGSGASASGAPAGSAPSGSTAPRSPAPRSPAPASPSAAP